MNFPLFCLPCSIFKQILKIKNTYNLRTIHKKNFQQQYILKLQQINKMFKKLHTTEHKNYSKRQTSYAQKSANRQKLKQSSYVRLHQAKKITPSQSLNYRIVSNDNYIYQGQWLNQYRNGQGIVLLKNGTLIIGHWQKDILDGRALIITPFGAIISGDFICGKLNGWMLAQHRDKVVIANLFYQDHMDGPRIVYEGSQQLWIATSCTIDGQLIKITHVQKGQRTKLPLFVQNDQLLQLFQQIISKKNLSYTFNTIKTINITNTTRYIGFVDKQNNPAGIGVTYSQMQCFIGNFKNGFLQQLGRMIFQNGDIYHGGLSAGQFVGHGIYYNPHKNQTMVMLSTPDQQPQILQQQPGYYLVDFQLKLGQKISKQDKITFSPILQKFLKTLQRYYHQYYIQQRMRQQQHYSNMSQQQSQNNKKYNDFPDEQENKCAIKPSKWIVDNDNAVSEQGNQENIKSYSHNKIISEQRYFSPKNASLDEQFYSIRIKQNQDPGQKEKYNRHNPNVNQYRKQMLNSRANIYIENASKSLDVNQLTFRGTQKTANKPQQTQPIKNKNQPFRKTSYGEQYSPQLQSQHESIVPPTSEKNSSNFSQLDEKFSGMLKKSSFRKKIFE